jgi:hypothetical protein
MLFSEEAGCSTYTAVVLLGIELSVRFPERLLAQTSGVVCARLIAALRPDGPTPSAERPY